MKIGFLAKSEIWVFDPIDNKFFFDY